MKKAVLSLLFILSFFYLNSYVQASTITSRAILDTNGVNIRKGPGTNYDRITYGYRGSYYNLVTTETSADKNNNYNCDSGEWYQIYYNGISTGYVCGDHVEVVGSHNTDDIEPTTECEQEMSDLGFPSSYWGGLCNLKSKYPSWRFTPIKTELEWTDVVSKQSACGLNYIYGSGSDGFYDPTCSLTSPGGYVAPNQSAIAYYMDPRNFLSERMIFQFLYLGYDTTLASLYPSGVTNIIGNTAFNIYHTDKNVNLSVLIDKVGSELGISPIFTAARITQELGSGTSLYNLYSGAYTGEEGIYLNYYNFYNFGVSDTCVAASGTTLCGLRYAYKMGWNSVEAAIKGGISQISQYYVNAGQYTSYLQKFNVVPTNASSIHNHQYMSNVAAPSSESGTTYSSYSNMGILSTTQFDFRIPVYLNMSATIDNSGSGATGGTTDNTVSTLPISTIVTSSGYDYTTGYISKIEPGTDIATIKGTIESVSGHGSVTIQDKNGNVITEGAVATGQKVIIKNSTSTENLAIIVRGDTSGDGLIDALDLLQVQKSILGTYTLNEAYKLAADSSKDGVVNALDLLQIQKSILKTYTIVQ